MSSNYSLSYLGASLLYAFFWYELMYLDMNLGYGLGDLYFHALFLLVFLVSTILYIITLIKKSLYRDFFIYVNVAFVVGLTLIMFLPRGTEAV
ncbi:hypothetical protein FUAX_53540 (plasmid) [Fulvitalea axinellae]|uniref:Uncharacterized protein n=1 Tax=Fulvitalea axinellae TaxID=1182444 RepID=A0AAU9D6B5_9BACT|nr:hypothetical protein FUAX_53540 [Fulvitalea axinellae]